MKPAQEASVLEHLRAAIACVFGGLPVEALAHVEAARAELAPSTRYRSAAARGRKMNSAFTSDDARVMHGLDELRDATPVDLGGES